jgi:hypothetical protein
LLRSPLIPIRHRSGLLLTRSKVSLASHHKPSASSSASRYASTPRSYVACKKRWEVGSWDVREARLLGLLRPVRKELLEPRGYVAKNPYLPDDGLSNMLSGRWEGRARSKRSSSTELCRAFVADFKDPLPKPSTVIAPLTNGTKRSNSPFISQSRVQPLSHSLHAATGQVRARFCWHAC